MKKIILLGALLTMMVLSVRSQVQDISLTVAPTVEYSWWDNATILEDGPLVGGRVGFGFGQYFEIRGVYMKSFDTKGKLNDLNWDPASDLAEDIDENEVDITRYGGEMKANISFGSWLSPYLTIGTGIQKFEFNQNSQKLDKYEEEQIYVSGGLGAKINLSDRFVLALEGKNTVFNMNPGNPYLSSRPEDFKDKDDKKLYNWSALASLEIYLGGNDPRELTDLDKEYKEQFTGGLSGLKFVIEPGGQYVNFDDDSYFNDTYFLGGAVGVDLSKYVGLRGYYYQATTADEFEDIRLDKFNDHLAMYGGNVLARLNNPTGVVPYMSVGGGYLNADSDYKDSKGTYLAESTGYANAGLGIEIPLGKYFLLYGSANYMVSTAKDIEAENVVSTSDLEENAMYRAGLRIQIGGKAEPQDALNARLDKMEKSNDEKIEKIREDYEKRIDELNEELREAYDNDDVDEAVRILEERDRTERSLNDVDYYNSYDDKNKKQVKDGDAYLIKMTPEEFEKLVEKVMNNLDEQEAIKQGDKERIEALENALIDMNTTGVSGNQNATYANSKILEELKELNRKIDRNTDMIAAATTSGDQPAVVVNSDGTNNNSTQTTQPDSDENITESNKNTGGAMNYNGSSVFTGPSFGDAFNWNLGLRGYYGVGVENLQLMPELYFGFGDETAFGLSANAIYTFSYDMEQVFDPYLGFGVGFFNHDDLKFGTNIILGTSIKVLDGRLFVDYSIRNMFKNNQLAVGYRFSF